MPFLDHQLFVLGRNRLGFRDITQFHPLGFPQLDAFVKIEYRLFENWCRGPCCPVEV